MPYLTRIHGRATANDPDRTRGRRAIFAQGVGNNAKAFIERLGRPRGDSCEGASSCAYVRVDGEAQNPREAAFWRLVERIIAP